MLCCQKCLNIFIYLFFYTICYKVEERPLLFVENMRLRSWAVAALGQCVSMPTYVQSLLECVGVGVIIQRRQVEQQMEMWV